MPGLGAAGAGLGGLREGGCMGQGGSYTRIGLEGPGSGAWCPQCASQAVPCKQVPALCDWQAGRS